MEKSRIRSRFSSLVLVLVLTASLWAPARAQEGEYVPPQDPDIQAKGALLMDLEGGSQLYGKNERQELYPASLTKIMTALLVLEAFDRGEIGLERMVTASEIVTTLPADSSTAGIKPGEVLTARQLMYCLLVSSANEAGLILGEYVAGSVGAFVERMNQRAQELGCEHTHFVNPHGFHDDDHYTTCWDMWLITREALKHEEFLRFCDTAEIVIPATNIGPERTLRTTNLLLSQWRVRGYKNDEAHGVKTGSTSQAGNCLIATAQRGELHLLSVVMGAENVRRQDGTTDRRSFSETNRLFEWGFQNFRYKMIVEEGEAVEERPVALSKTDHTIAVAKSSLRALMPSGLDPAMLQRRIAYTDPELEAPVEEGQVLGKLALAYDGTVYGTTELLAATGAERDRLMALQRDALALVGDRRFQIGAGGAVVLIAAAVLLRASSGRRRRNDRYGGRTTGGGYKGY